MEAKVNMTIFESFSAIIISMMEIVPDLLRILVLVATLVHLVIQINKSRPKK